MSWFESFQQAQGLQLFDNVPKFVVNLAVHFPNNQLRLSLYQLPAESQTY
jgi:hypothetical protein